MNINSLIYRIKAKIGLNGILKGIYTDEKIRDIILNITLNEYNNIHGFTISITTDHLFNMVSNNTIKRYDMNEGVNILPLHNFNSNEWFFKLPRFIMDDLKRLGSEVRRIFVSKAKNRMPFGGLPTMKNDIIGMKNAQFRRGAKDPPKFRFKAPDTVVMENYFPFMMYNHFNMMKLYIEVTHPRSLATITRGLASQFEELAMYDVMMSIYNNDLRLLNVDIGNSKVETQSLENFTSAEGNRKELLEKIKLRATVDSCLIAAI